MSNLFYKIDCKIDPKIDHIQSDINLSDKEQQQHYFISDLHLTPNRPELLEKFKSFIETEQLLVKPLNKTLYILGDLFDFWIGDDAASQLNHQIDLDFLKELSNSGLKIYVMHGNRDFLLSTKFEQDTGCQLIPDPSLINLNSLKILLVHGDDLCGDDVSHQKFRSFSRHYFPKWIKFTPISIRLKIARKLRQKSQRGNKSMAMMDVKKQCLLNLLNEHQPDLIIHGHIHRPINEVIELDNKSVTRIVLNNW